MNFNPKLHPTFQQQFDKITKAYFKNELQPFKACACFIGNMLNGNQDWRHGRIFFDNGKSLPYNVIIVADTLEKESNLLYSMVDIVKLENNFLKKLKYSANEHQILDNGNVIAPSYTEENLYKAMESTLVMLREMHEQKGEIVQDYSFVKRELVNI
jgi:hypothetical protein